MDDRMRDMAMFMTMAETGDLEHAAGILETPTACLAFSLQALEARLGVTLRPLHLPERVGHGNRHQHKYNQCVGAQPRPASQDDQGRTQQLHRNGRCGKQRPVQQLRHPGGVPVPAFASTLINDSSLADRLDIACCSQVF
ncbi:hypothetical protein FOC84_29970 [Achromobacter pestifer]|uniref:Uncharacterized protein n=1 Tax=Achromobacter pestifer TaxID=1353889 RepID=A0A7D4E5L6_9BURK|nr:hypothetical protein [Achromobacter pestifer]QKH38934.1 hypothetical protein FOC84_29970 [Achromobacter pestifer]